MEVYYKLVVFLAQHASYLCAMWYYQGSHFAYIFRKCWNYEYVFAYIVLFFNHCCIICCLINCLLLLQSGITMFLKSVKKLVEKHINENKLKFEISKYLVFYTCLYVNWSFIAYCRLIISRIHARENNQQSILFLTTNDKLYSNWKFPR